MQQDLKIIQLSDCHISAAEDAGYRGINPRQSLEDLLPAVRAWAPHLVLLTGDLAEDGSKDAYEYLAARLNQLGVPVYTVPGNHDHWLRQKSVFAETALQDPLLIERQGWQVILLNSAVEGQVPGTLTERMISGLQRALTSPHTARIIVLHHQPLEIGSPWIDRFPLLQPESFWSCVDGREDVRAVLWGHIHHAWSGQRNGVKLLGAPSTSVNSLAGQEKFNFDAAGPACRWLKLGPGGGLETGILYSA